MLLRFQVVLWSAQSPPSQGKRVTSLRRRPTSPSNHIAKYDKTFPEELDDAGGEYELGRGSVEEIRDVNKTQDAEVEDFALCIFYPSCVPIMY